MAQKTALGPHGHLLPFSDAYAPKSGVPTPVTGSFTATADKSSAALSGLTINVGTMSAVAGLSAAAFTGLVPRTGTMLPTADKARADLTGVVINIGDGTVSAPLCRFSGTGVTASDPPRVGSFQVTADKASTPLTGVVHQVGDFDRPANASAAAFTGAVVRIGQFAKPAVLSRAALSGAVHQVGEFAVLSSLSGALLRGTRTRVGSFAVVSAGGVSLSGDVTNIGSFSAVSSTSRFSGTGGNIVSATVVNADATHQVTDGPLIAAAILDARTKAPGVGASGQGNTLDAGREMRPTSDSNEQVQFLRSGDLSGLRYFEATVTGTPVWGQGAGFAPNDYTPGNYTPVNVGGDTDPDAIGVVCGNVPGTQGFTYVYRNGAVLSTAPIALSTGSVLMCAINVGSGMVWFGADGTWIDSGNPATGVGGWALTGGVTFRPIVFGYGVSYHGLIINSGQRPFLHGPPTGFRGLGAF